MGEIFECLFAGMVRISLPRRQGTCHFYNLVMPFVMPIDVSGLLVIGPMILINWYVC